MNKMLICIPIAVGLYIAIPLLLLNKPLHYVEYSRPVRRPCLQLNASGALRSLKPHINQPSRQLKSRPWLKSYLVVVEVVVVTGGP